MFPFVAMARWKRRARAVSVVLIRSTADGIHEYPLLAACEPQSTDYPCVDQNRTDSSTSPYEELTVRADASRQRIWFIEPTSGLVFATQDRRTGDGSLWFAQRPAWAGPNSGTLLPPARFPLDSELALEGTGHGEIGGT